MHLKRILFLVLLLGLIVTGTVMAQGGTISYGSSIVGTLSASAPLGFFTFSGSGGDLVTVDVIGISPGLDPAVSLNSPTQQQLANNDNNPTSLVSTDARISLSLPQNGIYTILVSSVTGAPGDFLLRLTGQPAAQSSPLADTPADTSVGAGLAQTFSFSANPDGPVTLNVTTSTPGFTFQATVRSANGQIVAILSGDDTAGVSLNLPPGTETYTVQVSGVNANVQGQVSINVGSAASAAPPPPQPTVPPPAETQEAQPPAATDVCMVTPGQGTVNVRSGPGTNNNVVAQLQPGQSLPVTGITGGWYQVNVPGVGSGYVSNTVVFTTGQCNNVPVIDPNTGQTQTDQQPAPPTLTPSATFTLTPQTQQQDTLPPTSTFTPTTQQQSAPPTPTFTATTQQVVPPTATFTPSYTPRPATRAHHAACRSGRAGGCPLQQSADAPA